MSWTRLPGIAAVLWPVALVACSSGGGRPSGNCPADGALEQFHALLAEIEASGPEPHIAAIAGQLSEAVAAGAFRSMFGERAQRALALADGYSRTPAERSRAREEIRIEASALRLFLHESACMSADLHRSFHQTLGMVRVPAGPFTRGCDVKRHPMCAPEETPAVSVQVPRFWLDRTEVTRGSYLACVEAGVCALVVELQPGVPADHPMTGLTFAEARAYCQFLGKRLPTEVEWEKAARGTDGRRYPWGDDAPTCDRARYDQCQIAGLPVGSFPDSRSPYGALDMAGSAAEWVDGWFAEAGGQRIVRDDAYDAWHMRSTARSAVHGDSRGHAIGFRCARGP